jgi:hypothetical protein
MFILYPTLSAIEGYDTEFEAVNLPRKAGCGNPVIARNPKGDEANQTGLLRRLRGSQ